MQLDKRKYKKAEVEAILAKVSYSYEMQIAEYKGQNATLADESAMLNKKIVALKKQIKKLNEEIQNYVVELDKPKKSIKKSNGEIKSSFKNTDNKNFDPKNKIAQFIAKDKGKCYNGVDLNEITKVDDSQLGDICKELGLTES